MKLILRTQFPVLAILVLAFFCARGMDDTFKPTGKQYTEPGWNVPSQAFPDSIENASTPLILTFVRGRPAEIKEKFTKNSWLKVNSPSIAHQLTDRIEEFGSGYMYPLQFAIDMSSPLSTIETILELGSPKEFPGYDPFKHILTMVITRNIVTGLLASYTRALLHHGISPDTQTAASSGTEQAIHKYCSNMSARQCVDILIAQEVNLGLDQTKLGNLNKIKTVFDQNRPSATASPGASTITLSAPASTSASPLPSLVPGNNPKKLTWRDTVSQWCKEPRSHVAKATVCIVALAAVAVTTKLLYNRLFSKNTEIPSQIIITNKSGTIVTVGYKTNVSNDLTSVTLHPEQVWSLDMSKIKLNLIITEEETAQNPLPINLERYKASVQQKNKALHITIGRNTGLRFWLSGIPYTYSATWQK